MLNKIGASLAILTVLSSLFLWSENHYALAAEVAELQERLEFKIVEDKLYSIEQRLYPLLVAEKKGKLDVLMFEQLELLKNQKVRIQAQYNALLSK